MHPSNTAPPKPVEKKLIDTVRDAIRLKHYAIRTEEAYVNWIRRFILFHGKRHPKDMGGKEIEAFLTHLANDLHPRPPARRSGRSQPAGLTLSLCHQAGGRSQMQPKFKPYLSPEAYLRLERQAETRSEYLDGEVYDKVEWPEGETDKAPLRSL